MLDKRAQLQDQIIKQVERDSERYYSMGNLLIDMRSISGEITEHMTITGDKLGEISLKCLMVRHVLQLNNQRIATECFGKAYNVCVYIVEGMLRILIRKQKQDEDLYLDFRDDIEAIGEFLGNKPNLMKVAIHNGLDINWLVQFNIPPNVERNLRLLCQGLNTTWCL